MSPAMQPRRSDTAAEAWHILGLAWPVMLTSLNWTLMQLIDVAIVGHAGAGRAGTEQLGYLAAGRTLTFITILMGLAALSGVLVFASRADGAGRLAETGEWLRRGLLFGLALGLPCLIVLFCFALPLLRLVGVPADIAGGAGAARVTQALALAYPFQFVQIAVSFFLEGVSRPRRVMVINLITLPLNALLAWAWADGHLGLPAMGAVGAVLATSLVSVVGAAGMLIAAWTLPDAAARNVRDLSPAAWRGALRGVPAMFRFGLVPAIGTGLELFGYAWLIILSTRLGAVPAAALQTVFALHNFAFSMALGFASAAGVRVGNAIGAGERQRVLPRILIATGLTVLAMGLVGLAFWWIGGSLVRPFSDDPVVVALSAGLLVLVAPFIWLDGVQLVAVYALRSLGHQIAAGANGVVAFFVVTGGLGTLFVRYGYGTRGLIYAFIAGIAIAAILQSIWLLRATRRLPQG